MRIKIYHAIIALTLVTMFTGEVFAIDNASFSIQDIFIPSGYMGDGEYGDKYVFFDGNYTENPHSAPMCIFISYTFGPKTWAGIYWQNINDNWGNEPGEDFTKKGFNKITFWARGKQGGEVIEFKSGGIKDSNKQYKDSYHANLGRVTLESTWNKYEIELNGKELSSVIGGFCWVVSAIYNKGNQVQFFLDDIQFVK